VAATEEKPEGSEQGGGDLNWNGNSGCLRGSGGLKKRHTEKGLMGKRARNSLKKKHSLLREMLDEAKE